MNNKDVIITNKRKLINHKDFWNIPSPYYDSKIRKGVLTAQVETSRGCPNDCDYCTVNTFYGGAYRMIPIQKAIEKLRLIKNIGNNLMYTDDNSGGVPKRGIEFFNTVVEEGLERLSSAQFSVKVGENPELLDAAWKAGVRTLYIGIESPNNDETLRDLKKPYTAKENRENIKRIRERGFWIHGMMMPGGDGDTLDSLEGMSEWAKENIDSAQYFPPTPLPGTPFFKRLENEGRILTQNLSLYDCQHVVMRPAKMTPFELQTKVNQMYEDFWSLKEMMKRVVKRKDYIGSNLGLIYFAHLKKIKDKVLYNPQMKQHLEFLKKVS